MRIVLVHPAGSNWIPGRPDITPTANRMAPLGLLSIAAWLERDGHAVAVHDCLGPAAPSGNRGHVEAILGHRPDLVGFSATTSAFLDACALARALKARRPEIATVCGGVHASALGGELLARFPEMDFLGLGEGEGTLAELAQGTAPAGIRGLVWRDGDRVVANPPREHLPDLDRLPFPAYHRLTGFPRGYNLPLFSYVRRPGATMVTSRGCPFQCSYCDRSVFRKSYRTHSAAYIYDHLRHLRRDFGVRHVNIYDDLFTAHRERIFELGRMLVDRPLGVQFNCAVRVGQADEELLRLLKRAGCLQVSLGIESGDENLLAAHKPGVAPAAARDTVRRIQACGLRAKGLFMMGLPGETAASIGRTSDFVLSLGLDDMNMTKFTPFPGAPVWRTIREEGLLEEDWRRMNCLNFVFLPRGVPSWEELDQLYNRHVQRFYADPGWRRRFTRRLWQHRWSLWHLLRHWPTFAAARRQFEPQASAP